MEILERVLAAHPFFNDLNPEYLKLLIGCASHQRFEAGQYLFREGQEANRFYLIREGKVALEIFSPQSAAINIATADDGDIIGWSWLLSPYRWRFDARVLQETHAIALDGKRLRAICEQNHDLGYELLKRFANIIEQRLNATTQQLLGVHDELLVAK